MCVFVDVCLCVVFSQASLEKDRNNTHEQNAPTHIQKEEGSGGMISETMKVVRRVSRCCPLGYGVRPNG